MSGVAVAVPSPVQFDTTAASRGLVVKSSAAQIQWGLSPLPNRTLDPWLLRGQFWGLEAGLGVLF